MAKILVTGGAGFIGSNTVAQLIREGHCVRVLDNFSTGTRRNLKKFLNEIELIEADLRDLEVVKKAMKGVDYCLHQAALSSVERSVRQPLETIEVNIRGTLNLLMAAKEEKVKKVVFSSSSSIYGGGEDKKPLSEKDPFNPVSHYAVTKLVGEHYCRIFFRLYGMEIITLRYFNVFGPYQDPESEYAAVIPRFIYACLKGRQPLIYGDGQQSRDFTYVDNVVGANTLALNNKSHLGGECFNIATSRSISVNKLWDLISNLAETRIKARHVPPRQAEVRHSLADISKARNKLGYSVKVDFNEGLKRTIEYFRECRGY
jgi:nucleoside-diphosphate-sugar epimerase